MRFGPAFPQCKGATIHTVVGAATTGEIIMKAQKSATTAKRQSIKDLKPKKDAAGGIGLLLPAVQKVREAAPRGG